MSKWINAKKALPEIKEWSDGSIAGISDPVVTYSKITKTDPIVQRLRKGGRGDLTSIYWSDDEDVTHWAKLTELLPLPA